jgi:hypothetical protein
MLNSVNHREPYPGHASNKIGTQKKPARVTRVYAKLGEVCEQIWVMLQIKSDNKFRENSVWEILQHLFAKYCGISRNYSYEINFNRVFREIKKSTFVFTLVNGLNPYKQLSKTLTLILTAGRLTEPLKTDLNDF